MVQDLDVGRETIPLALLPRGPSHQGQAMCVLELNFEKMAGKDVADLNFYNSKKRRVKCLQVSYQE